MSQLQTAREILVYLLSTGPKRGATLKQFMRREFVHRGLGRFDQNSLGFYKFSEFLAAQTDLVVVERPEGPGDITVSLTNAGGTPAATSSPHSTQGTENAPDIRRAIWKAFTNPDPNRKRFIDKKSGAVKHFLDAESSPTRASIQASPDQFVEIKCVSGEEQLAWMTAFIVELDLPDHERLPLERLASERYSSSLNSTFALALRRNGARWKQYRTANVTHKILEWAKENSIDKGLLRSAPDTDNKEGVSMKTGRDKVVALLEMLTDEQIKDLVLPLLLSTVWLTSRTGN